MNKEELFYEVIGHFMEKMSSFEDSFNLKEFVGALKSSLDKIPELKSDFVGNENNLMFRAEYEKKEILLSMRVIKREDGFDVNLCFDTKKIDEDESIKRTTFSEN